MIENFDITSLKAVLRQITDENGDTPQRYEITDEGTVLGKTKDGLEVKVVHQEGGGEGGAEHCESVLQIGENNFLKITYSYYSHEGFEFDYTRQNWVTPHQKTVTVYK